MKEGQIIQMMKKVVAENQNYTTWTVSTPHLVALVNHAIEVEREACAKVCEEVGEHPSLEPRHCAESIRARKEA